MNICEVNWRIRVYGEAWLGLSSGALGTNKSGLFDAHRDGKRYVVRPDEKLTAFVELEAAVRSRCN